jgi:magnesium chelatase family protein
MDRIHIHMQVPRVEFAKLRDMRPGETSAAVRVRVEAARERQRILFACTT